MPTETITLKVQDMLRYKLVLLLILTTITAAAQKRHSHLIHFDMSNSLMSGTINDLAQDKHGLLWIATDMGVCRFDGYNFNGFKMKRKGKDDYDIKALTVDGTEDIVYATDIFGNTFAINSSSQQTATAKGKSPRLEHRRMEMTDGVKAELALENISPSVVTCVMKDNCGNIWIGTHGMGLYVLPWRKSIFEITYIEDAYVTPTTSGTKDKQGNTWTIDKHRRLVKKDTKGNSRIVPIGNDAYSNIVYCLFADRRGTLWIGSYRGLAFLECGVPKFIEDNNKLENLCVNSICADRTGNIWVGNKRGLARYDVKNNKLTNFDERDGLPCREFIDGGARLEDDGRLTFLFVGGKCQFNPAKTDVNTSTRQLLPAISEIKAYDGNRDTIIDTENDVVISHNFNTVRIKFFVNDLVCKQNVKYQYRLVGYDKEWRGDNKENSVEYSNLPHGDYTFEVKARLRNQDFNDKQIARIRLTINPPLWLSWQAKMAYISLFVVLVILLAWLMGKLIAKRSEEQAQKVRQQQEENFRKQKLELYANITHELRTPLTLILGPLDDLISDRSIPSAVTTTVTTIRRSALRLLEMVNRLLDSSNADDIGDSSKCAPCDMVAIVKESVAMVKELNTNKELAIEFRADEGIMPMESDAEALRIIVDNIVGNAIKYTPRGSISVSVCLTGNDSISLTVADTGYGIEEQALAHIFEKGYKANGEHQASGSGLGLALVKSICGRLGGDVTVNSKVNVGTTFTVTLPYIPLDTRPANFSNANDSRKKILVVEDNSEIRRYIVETLSSEYSTLQAINGKDGLDIANTSCPDMIISDVMMPIMDGLEMCKTIKENMATSHIPVVLLTAKVTLTDKEYGYDVGADSYITKPFSGRLLLARVRNIFASRKRLSEKLANMVAATSRTEENKEESPEGLSVQDCRFINQMKQIISDNIANEQLDVDFIADKMGMSRSTLYRKVKSLTNMSTGSIINNARLEKAAWLLTHEGATVSEAAYKSGWGDMSNFRQAFKKKYGHTPKELKTRTAH